MRGASRQTLSELRLPPCQATGTSATDGALRISSTSTRSPKICDSVSPSISKPDLTITPAMTAPSQASMDTCQLIYIIAAASVEAEIIESSLASSPELIKDSELTLRPTLTV